MAIGVPMLWQLAFELVLNVRMRRYQEAREELAEEWDLDAPRPERDTG